LQAGDRFRHGSSVHVVPGWSIFSRVPRSPRSRYNELLSRLKVNRDHSVFSFSGTDLRSIPSSPFSFPWMQKPAFHACASRFYAQIAPHSDWVGLLCFARRLMNFQRPVYALSLILEQKIWKMNFESLRSCDDHVSPVTPYAYVTFP